MKLIKIFSIVLAILIIAACHTSKKTTKSATSTVIVTNTTPNPTVTTQPVMIAKSYDGIFAPGNDELIAIQTKYKDCTLQTLAEGYSLYTTSCTNCHKAKNIYYIPDERWYDINENMSRGAHLTDTQKDAVYKYVLAIKATKPK